MADIYSLSIYAYQMTMVKIVFCRISHCISVLQIITNFKNTVHGFKKFHGRAFDDPFVQGEKPKLPYGLHKLANGNTGIKVKQLSEVT